MLIWVTGNSGSGKSTVCHLLKRQGRMSLDADWEGFTCWVNRSTDERIANPPDPVPQGWLDDYAWRIDRARVAGLAAQAAHTTAFLCGSVDNENEVWDLFDRVVCLVAADDTLRQRLADRTSNSFGKHPEELAAVLKWNPDLEARYRGYEATIVDAELPVDDVLHQVLSAADVDAGSVGC